MRISLIARAETDITRLHQYSAIVFVNLYPWSQLRFKVYYQLYTNDNPLESFNPIYSNDKTVGHTLFKSITPPCNVASLKKSIFGRSKVLTVSQPVPCISLSEKAPADDSTRLPFQGGAGSGSSEIDARALVVNIPEIQKRSAPAKTAASKTLHESPIDRVTVCAYFFSNSIRRQHCASIPHQLLRSARSNHKSP